MKIYLASFFEKKNHGPGRLISVSLDKPRVDTDGLFEELAPTRVLADTYKSEQFKDPKQAGVNFRNDYKAQLSTFVDSILLNADKKNIKPSELLPFNDGDTLACWEREGNTSYRGVLSEYLEKLGYEVELH